MARKDNILSSLGTKYKIVSDITFISKMAKKVWEGVRRHDKIGQNVIPFYGAWELNLKMSLKLLFYIR